MRRFFSTHKHVFDKEKLIIIILGYIFYVNLPIIRFFILRNKILVPTCRTSNLRDSTVYGFVSAYSLFDVAVPV